MREQVPDTCAAAPVAKREWPPRLNTEQAADYLNEEHGLPVVSKTLRNWRAARKGPVWRYFGTVPLTTPLELDRYVREEALQDEAPAARTRRLAKAARRQLEAPGVACDHRPNLETRNSAAAQRADQHATDDRSSVSGLPPHRSGPNRDAR
jgi:hypothetical protein